MGVLKGSDPFLFFSDPFVSSSQASDDSPAMQKAIMQTGLVTVIVLLSLKIVGGEHLSSEES